MTKDNENEKLQAEKAELLGGLDSIAFQCNPHLNAGISLEIIEREAKQLLNKYSEGGDDNKNNRK